MANPTNTRRFFCRDSVVATAFARGFAALSMLAALASPALALGVNDKLDLRVLVLSADGTEPSFAAWTTALSREGVPFDTIIANTADPIVNATLASAADHARYQAVILATGQLYQCGATGCFSALSADEWLALNAFQTRFSIRRVTAYAYPTPDYGLNWPFFAGDVSGTTANLSAAGSTAFPYLVGQVPMDAGTYGYYAEPLAANFTTLVAGPVGSGGKASALVGVYARPDGFEEMVVTVATNQYQNQSLLLGHGLIAWATHGIRLGYQRNYFTMHVDDIFLPDDRWDVNDDVTHEDDGEKNPLIRMVPSDVDRAKAWQAKTGLQLDFVFNGGGSAEAIAEFGTDPLTQKLLANKGAFYWINHTYSHPNLDFLSAAQILQEIKLNFSFATKNKLNVNKTELVTGEHSGLGNPNLAIALNQTAVTWVAADNSKQPTAYAIGKATTIPRYPTNLYYNVGTFDEQLDEYNYLYFENCVNTSTTTCFSAPATWADYVNSEATIMLRHLLLNDPRPHYIHQGNLAEDGTMYPVVNEVLARYKQYVKTPIKQPLYRDTGAIMRTQSNWLATSTGPAGALITAYYKGGAIYLASPTAISVPVTGTTTGTLYGGEYSQWLSVPALTTKALKVKAPF